jgi:hypothetical protein
MADAAQPQKGLFQILLENPKTKAWVEWIKDIWIKIKDRPLMCLLVGFFIGVLIFGFSIRKNILFKSWIDWLTEKNQQVAGHLDRKLPKQAEVKILGVTEEVERWQSAEVRWLEQEAGAEKKSGVVADFVIKRLEWKEAFDSPTQKFEWFLIVSPGYSLSGSGYRVHKAVNGRKLFEQLRVRKDPLNPDSLIFSVPESEKSDVLMAIVALKGKEKPVPADVRLIFQSRTQ